MEENFFKGIFFGTLFSVPLWIAVIGWGKLIVRLFN